MTSVGTVRYLEDWWIRLEVDYELGRYFRHLFFAYTYKVYKLGRPSRNEHITIVSSEEYNISFNKFWKKYDGAEIEFNIVIKPQTNGNAYWFPIISEGLDNIRYELGLKNKTVPFHLAIGYLNPGKIGKYNER